MRNELMTTSAEEFCDSVRDGTHDSPKQVDEGRYLVTSRHITGGRLDLENAYMISSSDFDEINKRSKVDQWDVLITMIGTVGDVHLVKDKPVFAIKNIGLFKSKSELEGKWLYYYLQSAEAKHTLRTLARGTTQQYIPLGALRKFPVLAPRNMTHMRQVVEVLWHLDQKIELNRQANQTLESMAQALFKSWFVDFDPVIDNALAAGNEIPEPLAAKASARRALQEQGADKANQPHTLPDHIRQLFPSRFQFTEELGWIPEGWTNSPLDEVIDLIGGGTPKTSEPNYWGGDIPWFSVVDAPNPSDVFVINTEKRITQSGLANSSARLLPAGTSIISARGTVGKCALAARPMAMNQSCYGVRGKGEISDSYVYYTVFLQVGDLQQRGHGSVFNTITRDTFKTVRIAFGGEHITHAFDELCSTYFNRIKENLIQIDTLSNLRDLLLPKLLSGELRIPEAENKLEATLA